MKRGQIAMPTKSQTTPTIDPDKFNAFIGSAKDEQVEQSRSVRTSDIDQTKTFPFKASKAFHERMVKAARYEGQSLKDFMNTAVLKEVERIEKSRK
jgi:hypothetical protein